MEQLTLDISGRKCSASSESIALQSSWVNRLRQNTRLLGSTLFYLTWKERVTPQGRSICALRASVRRTSGNACGSWPRTRGQHGCGPSDGTTRGLTPEGAARLASWPTPNAGPQNDNDSNWQVRRSELKEKHRNGNGFGMTLGMAATYAFWNTPQTRDYKGDPDEPRKRG